MPAGRNLTVLEWSHTNLATLAAQINASLGALGEQKVLDLVIRSDGTTYYAYAVASKG
jgi:hypothetical protein